jgi:GNAT superfamily N-acetyltransferase
METRDKDAVIALAMEFSRERLEKDGMFVDPIAASAQFDQFIVLPNVVALVSEVDSVVIGMIVCFVSPLVFTSQVIGQEVVWYVNQENRSHGVRLLKKAEDILREKGCQSIMMVGLNGDRSCEFYERFGYTLFQKTYMKRLV